MKVGGENNGLFDHMNQNNLSKAEMDKNRIKKRKINDISKNSEATENDSKEFKQPGNLLSKQTTAPKTAQEIKECPFNPFGDESCDMCGA